MVIYAGFGMTLETGKDGVTRVMAVARHGSAAAGGVVVGSEVIAVAGCTLERGQVPKHTHLQLPPLPCSAPASGHC